MSDELVRQYVQRVLPWNEGEFVSLHWRVPNPKFDPSKPANEKDNRPNFLNGVAVTSVDEFFKELARVKRNPKWKDIYVAMASQARAIVKTINTGSGRSMDVRQPDRTRGNVATLKALFIDLDVKPSEPDKGYASTSDAFQALSVFLQKTGLPRPTLVVGSGTGGAHVYWVLDRALTVDEWHPLAAGLVEATRREGLKIDTQCTIDSTRILRPPGTLNYKWETPQDVRVIGAINPADHSVDHIRSILTPYMGAQVVPLPGAFNLPPASRRMRIDPNDDLGAGIESAARLIDIETVKPHCGFVREALDTGGATFNQSLWNVATLMATFVMGGDGSDGRAVAHAMAKGHPGYTPDTTDALYDRKVSEREATNIGWPSCSAIHGMGCQSCSGCPLLVPNSASRKGPLSSGRAYVAPVVPTQYTPQIPTSVSPATAPASPGHAPTKMHVPHGYQIDQKHGSATAGMIYAIRSDGQGGNTLVPVSDYLLTNPWLERNPWVLHFEARVPGQGAVDTIAISFDRLQSSEYAKHLAMQGLVVRKAFEKELKEFLLAWVSTLKTIVGATIHTEPYGWASENSKLQGFVYGGTLWGPNNSQKPAASPSPALEAQYKPTGDMKPWRDLTNFLTAQNRPASDALISLAFAAPLMRFTGKEGVVVSCFSTESGAGKSAAQAAAASVWGHGKITRRGLDDTANSTAGLMSSVRSLPIFWDELQEKRQIERFVGMVFHATRGVEKARMNANAELKVQGTWQTIFTCNTNGSMLDHVAQAIKSTEAGILRMFEFEITKANMGALPMGYVDRLVAATHENFGHAGLEYAKFLGGNFATIADEVAKCEESIGNKVGAPNDERFWVAAMTCMFMGAKYANRLGLTNINEQALLNFLYQSLKTMRQQHRVASVTNLSDPHALANVFQQYLGAHAAKYTLVTDMMPLGVGRPAPCMPQGDWSRIEHVLIRYAEKQRLLLVDEGHFREWCASRQYNASTVIAAMSSIWGVQHGSRVLTSGVNDARFSTQRLKTRVLEVNLAGSGFSGLHDMAQHVEDIQPEGIP